MTKTATLYRMVMADHVCPYGLKSKSLLQRKGYTVEDHHLTSRAETDAFKADHGVKTTPQTFIDGERIGGYDDLRVHFGLDDPDCDDKTYTPVLVVFAVALAMALAAQWALTDSLSALNSLEWFVAFSMTLLAMLKLRDLESFSTMFLGYDLLARRYVPYAYIYPVGEALAGLLMIMGGLFGLIAAPIALFIGTIGAVSVFMAVYIDKRDLKCACVGGDSNVPLGFISLSENIAMIGMSIWMVIKALG